MTRIIDELAGLEAEAIGAGGLAAGWREDLAAALEPTRTDWLQRHAEGQGHFLSLPFEEGTLARCRQVLTALPEGLDTVVVVGIGGSSLGAEALAETLGGRLTRRLVVLDNVDPDLVLARLATVDPARAILVPISKSGGTAETLANLAVALKAFESRIGRDETDRRVVAITGRADGPLGALAAGRGWATLPVPEAIGGRFSVLTEVGLFPLLALGGDADALLAGARQEVERIRDQPISVDTAALLAGAFQRLAVGGRTVLVVFAYTGRLGKLGRWFAQLWAESLGKRQGLDGSIVHGGSVPVLAEGAVDQHSQLQLYVEGPADRVVWFWQLDRPDLDVDILEPADGLADRAGFELFEGVTLGELLRAEREGSQTSLREAGVPVALSRFADLAPETLGAAFVRFEWMTILGGALWKVDPFDQPGVERSKVVTRELLGSR